MVGAASGLRVARRVELGGGARLHGATGWDLELVLALSSQGSGRRAVRTTGRAEREPRSRGSEGAATKSSVRPSQEAPIYIWAKYLRIEALPTKPHRLSSLGERALRQRRWGLSPHRTAFGQPSYNDDEPFTPVRSNGTTLVDGFDAVRGTSGRLVSFLVSSWVWSEPPSSTASTPSGRRRSCWTEPSSLKTKLARLILERRDSQSYHTTNRVQ